MTPTENQFAEWLEVRVDGGWLVRYRPEVVRGRLVFAEMHLAPAGSETPREGVTPALLRRVAIGEHRQLLVDEAARAFIEHLGQPHEPITLSRELFLSPAGAAEKPRRRRRDDRWYAEAARLYAALVEGGATHPLPTLAGQLGLAQSSAATVIRDARSMGLLTATSRGRAGGRLTAKARRILAKDTTTERGGGDG
jgi:hypothetical protein